MLFIKYSYINSLSLKAKKLNNKFFNWAFLGLILVSPSFFVFTFTDVFEYPKILLISIVLSFFLVFYTFNRKFITITIFDLIVLLGFIFIILLSFFSISPLSSFFGYFENSSNSVFYFLICFLFFIFYKKEIKRFKYFDLFNLIILSSVVPVFYALIQILNKDFFIWQNSDTRVFSTFGQPNFFAMYLVVVIGSLINILLKKYNLFLFIYLFLVLFCFYYTFSLSNFVVFAAYLLFIFVFHAKSFKIKFIIVVASLLFVIGILLTPIAERVKFQVINITNGNTKSINDTAKIRLILWKSSLGQSLEFPYFFVGRGYANFAYSYNRDKELNNTSEWGLIFSRPHNYLIEKLFEGGVFVFIFYVYLFFISVKNFKINSYSFVPFVIIFSSLFLWIPSYLYLLFLLFLYKELNFKNKYKVKSWYLLPIVMFLFLITTYYGVSNFYYKHNPCVSSKMFLNLYQPYYFKCSVIKNDDSNVYSAYKLNTQNKSVVEEAALYFLNSKNEVISRSVIFKAYNKDPHFPVFMYYKGLYSELSGDYINALSYYKMAQNNSNNFYQNSSAILRITK